MRLAHALAVTLCSPLAAQTTWYVDDDGTPPGTGTQNDPYTSIQYAIDQLTTVAGDTLQVAAGTYVETVDFAGKELRILGDALNRPAIDASGFAASAVTMAGLQQGTELRNFVVRSGQGNDCSYFQWCRAGGGVHVTWSSVTVEACLFDSAGTDYGGAVYSRFADLVLVDCSFSDNSASYGGSVYAEGGSIMIAGCSFQWNPNWSPGSTWGGAAYLKGTSASMAAAP